MTIHVKDADDQNPVFTQEVYKASVSETAKITVNKCLLRSHLSAIESHFNDRAMNVV